MTLFNNISNNGVSESMDYKTKLRIKIFNEIVFLLLILLLLKTILGVSNGYQPHWSNIAVFILLPTVLFLVHKNKHFIAYMLTTILLPLYAVSIILIYGDDIRGEVYVIALLMAVATLYDRKSIIIANSMYIMLLFGAVILHIDELEYPLAHQMNVIDKMANLFIAGFLTLWCFIRYSQGISNRQEALELRNNEIIEKNEELNVLNQQNQFKTKLIGLIAHDLRGPMAAFKNVSRILNRYITNQQYDKLVQMGDYFVDASHSLFHSLDNLLNWAVSQNNTITINATKFYLFDIIDDARMDAEQQIRAKHIEVSISVDKNIQVETDSNILRIIIRNIIENAAKYSPKASEIKVELEEKETLLALKIIDQGVGIDETLVKKLAAGLNVNTTIKTNSHGFGLQLCFHFAKLLNLEIDFKNLNGEGTAAIIKFPRNNIPFERNVRRLKGVKTKTQLYAKS